MSKKPLNIGNKLRIEVAPSYSEMSEKAADLIVSALKGQPALLLCASAGGTPTATYACLVARHRQQPSLFSKMRVLQIDEWGGFKPNSAATCAADLRQKLTAPLELSAARFAGFRTAAKNPAAECDRIARWLTANGPIDICILGLGLNGHIAMNEPGRELIPHSHVAALSASSQKHGMLRDLANKPNFGFTLGMQDIMCSRQILLLVSGAAKRQVLKRLLEPRVSTQFPASFLWLHPNVIVLCDREALGNEQKNRDDKKD